MPDFGSTIIGGLFNWGAGMFNNWWAQEREDIARKENYRLNELAAQNADARTRALYNDLQSPSAMLQQYKDAGLSPSLMFGGAGAGAQPSTGAMGAGVAGVAPTSYGVSALESAQIGLMQAQEKKIIAETKNTETDTDKKKAEVDNIVQNTKNQELQAEWQEWQNSISAIELNLLASYGEQEVQAKLGKTLQETANLTEQFKSLKAKGIIDEATTQDCIEYIKNRVVEQQAEIFLKRTQARLAQSQISLNSTQAQALLRSVAVQESFARTADGQLQFNKDKLQKQVEQWAVENGFKAKELQIEIGKAVADFYTKNTENLARLIDVITPF